LTNGIIFHKEAVTGLVADIVWSFTTAVATEINNETTDVVSVYPTQTSSKVTVKIPAGSATIKVIDLTGKQLSMIKSNNSETTLTLDNF